MNQGDGDPKVPFVLCCKDANGLQVSLLDSAF